MKYTSIVVEGQTIQELEDNLNKRIEGYNPAIYKISSPSMFNSCGIWVAICIVEPIFN